ncbi:hypothetical protein C5S53_05470 [Methanophagales archaeon]|nr:hypothetical protein C5S53_05470 [Methanophagales archaeon]
MVAIKRKGIRIKELANYGSSHHPAYTINVELEIDVSEGPDTLHRLFCQTGLISRETIPFDVVSDFRGSAEDNPFYSAVIMHEGITKEYRVMARDTGGSTRSGIIYEPVVYPEELRLMHPAEFAQLGIAVMAWGLHNYKYYFLRFIASKRYESFNIQVNRVGALTFLRLNLAESGLEEKKAPCSWYLKRLSIFEGFNLEEKVSKEIDAGYRMQDTG